MEYFELFELPVSLIVDSQAVTKKYYALSKKHHPDNFSLQNSKEQEDALDMSTKINQAKKILSDAHKRLEYILREKGILVSEERYPLPADFLASMMEINEMVMDLEFEPNEEAKGRIIKEMEGLMSNLYEDVKPFFEAEILEIKDAEAERLKDYYYKKKYLDRIQEKL